MVMLESGCTKLCGGHGEERSNGEISCLLSASNPKFDFSLCNIWGNVYSIFLRQNFLFVNFFIVKVWAMTSLDELQMNCILLCYKNSCNDIITEPLTMKKYQDKVFRNIYLLLYIEYHKY